MRSLKTLDSHAQDPNVLFSISKGQPLQLPPHLSPACADVLACMLQRDPTCRPYASELLRHSFFSSSKVSLDLAVHAGTHAATRPYMSLCIRAPAAPVLFLLPGVCVDGATPALPLRTPCVTVTCMQCPLTSSTLQKAWLLLQTGCLPHAPCARSLQLLSCFLPFSHGLLL